MKLLDLLFGNRLYLNDPELGKFFTEKKLKHSEPLLWKSYRPILQNSYSTQLNLEGSYTEIFPVVKEAFFSFSENYTTYEDQLRNKIIESSKENDAIQNLKVKEILGRKINAEAKLIVDFEYNSQKTIRVSIVNNSLEKIPT